MLSDAEWTTWSDKTIARHCGVTQPFVSKLRASLITVISEDETQPTTRIYRNRHGQIATMQTAAIGQRPAPEPSPPFTANGHQSATDETPEPELSRPTERVSSSFDDLEVHPAHTEAPAPMEWSPSNQMHAPAVKTMTPSPIPRIDDEDYVGTWTLGLIEILNTLAPHVGMRTMHPWPPRSPALNLMTVHELVDACVARLTLPLPASEPSVSVATILECIEPLSTLLGLIPRQPESPQACKDYLERVIAGAVRQWTTLRKELAEARQKLASTVPAPAPQRAARRKTPQHRQHRPHGVLAHMIEQAIPMMSNPFRAADIARHLGEANNKVNQSLNGLVRNGKLRKEGEKLTLVYYKVTPNPSSHEESV